MNFFFWAKKNREPSPNLPVSRKLVQWFIYVQPWGVPIKCIVEEIRVNLTKIRISLISPQAKTVITHEHAKGRGTLFHKLSIYGI